MIGFPVSLSPSDIEHELTAMWNQRGGKDEPGGVTHYTLGNVIWLGSTRHVTRTRRIFSELVSRFPCRLFLLECSDDTSGSSIESFVNAYCFAAKGHEGEVCCEEITLRFGRDALRHVTGAVLPLLIADVPTFFWYSSADPGHYGEALEQLIALADRVITEVAHMPDPAAGLRRTAEPGAKTTSLSWYRSHPVRDHIAGLFDERDSMERLASIERLQIGVAGSLKEVQALTNASVLIGWFASRLGWRVDAGAEHLFHSEQGPVAVEVVSIDAGIGMSQSQVVHFEAHCSTGDCLSLIVTGTKGGAERRVTGPCGTCRETPRFVHAREWTEAEALGFAFNSPHRHEIFQQAAAMAWPMLKRVLPT